MPTLVLPPRHTPDADAIGAAALQAGWTVERFVCALFVRWCPFVAGWGAALDAYW